MSAAFEEKAIKPELFADYGQRLPKIQLVLSGEDIADSVGA